MDRDGFTELFSGLNKHKNSRLYIIVFLSKRLISVMIIIGFSFVPFYVKVTLLVLLELAHFIYLAGK